LETWCEFEKQEHQTSMASELFIAPLSEMKAQSSLI